MKFIFVNFLDHSGNHRGIDLRPFDWPTTNVIMNKEVL